MKQKMFISELLKLPLLIIDRWKSGDNIPPDILLLARELLVKAKDEQLN